MCVLAYTSEPPPTPDTGYDKYLTKKCELLYTKTFHQRHPEVFGYVPVAVRIVLITPALAFLYHEHLVALLR
jgi:uncharacterized membrane protein